jgi:hypothetical protein
VHRVIVNAILCLVATFLVGCGPASPPAGLRSTPLPPTALAPTASKVCAVITQLNGDATVRSVSDSARRVLPLQVVCEGDILKVLPDGRADLVCSNDRWLSQPGPAELEITPATCARGSTLPAGAYAGVAPKAGVIPHAGGSLVVELETRERESDYGSIPVVLSPRNTALLDQRPAIRWVVVGDAVGYQIVLNGPAPAPLSANLDAGSVQCVSDPRYNLSTCTLPFPDGWPPLQHGKTYFLMVGARMSIAAPPRAAQDPNKLTILSQDQAAQVETVLASVQNVAGATSHDLLRGGLYAQHELYADAITAYEQVRSVQPLPVVAVTLGDLYRAIKLYRIAFDRYAEALKQLGGDGDPAVRAAAELGSGQVYYASQNFKEALARFQAAEKLYGEAGLAAEQSAAAQAAAEAQHRVAR